MTTPKDSVDLNLLQPVSIAELAAGPNNVEFNPGAAAPELFQQWWAKNRDQVRHKSHKQIARAAWYACAESLGVYE
jgi:hypothetical protein